MPTIAFFNLPARGHLSPTLPVVQKLVNCGAKVHYFISEEYREPIELAGSMFHSLPSLNRLGDDSTEHVRAPDDKQIALMPFAMAYQAPQVVPQLVEALRTLRPDCLVYNTLSLWPRLASRILDIPTVGFRPFHGPRTHRSVTAPFSSEGLAKLADATDRGLSFLMSSFGKPPLSVTDLVSQVDDLTLMFLLREFQHEAEAFDERFLFVGPSFMEGEPQSWPFADRTDRGLRRVYVSLGTMRNDDPEFYRACFSAFAPHEWQVVMSVGGQVDLDSLVPVPENFVVERNVQQTAILQHVDVFLTHGGLNSVMESLTFGVPMVVVPSIREQQLTASRVQDLGCGVELDRGSVTAASLLQYASAIIDDAAIKSRLRVLQERISAAGGYKQAASAILEYVRNVYGAHI
jgi:MGT family glycosyltransferase